MRVFGFLMIAVGFIWLGVSLVFDTTNGTNYNNLGLLFSQFENIVISCFSVLCGVVLFSISTLLNYFEDKSENEKNTETITEKSDSPIAQKMKSFGEKLNDYQIR